MVLKTLSLGFYRTFSGSKRGFDRTFWGLIEPFTKGFRGSIEPLGGFGRTFLGWSPISGYRFKNPSAKEGFLNEGLSEVSSRGFRGLPDLLEFAAFQNEALIIITESRGFVVVLVVPALKRTPLKTSLFSSTPR